MISLAAELATAPCIRTKQVLVDIPPIDCTLTDRKHPECMLSALTTEQVVTCERCDRGTVCIGPFGSGEHDHGPCPDCNGGTRTLPPLLLIADDRGLREIGIQRLLNDVPGLRRGLMAGPAWDSVLATLNLAAQGEVSR